MKRIIILVFVIFLAACNQKETESTIKVNGFVFGTSYNISYIGNTSTDFQQSIDSLFNLVNKSLSTYLPTSDISKINDGNSDIIVDAMFKEVFQKSTRIYKETDGYFDPTVGNLVNAWGFGPDDANEKLDTATVKKMMKLVGFHKIHLIDDTIVKEDPAIFIDFNSIAKGYGVDVIGRFLEKKLITNYLVEIGGEIRAKGNSLKGRPWKIAIEKPNTDGSQSFQKTIELSNQSMATSGNYRKFRITSEGKKVVHTVNPKTGFASESNLLSVSVISSLDCADVDAYATAFMAMGFEKTKAFVKNHTELTVVLLYANDKGELVEFISE